MAGNNKYNRLQFLHIPCNSRHLASANRFSVPGMPCSYMASAKRVAWYECKMPDSFQWAKFEAVKHDKKLIQLDHNPLTSTLSLISELSKERWTEDERKSFAREYCFILPLIASCSVIATVYKGNIIKNLIMDCQSYTKYRPNETTGGIFVSWRRKEELPTGA